MLENAVTFPWYGQLVAKYLGVQMFICCREPKRIFVVFCADLQKLALMPVQNLDSRSTRFQEIIEENIQKFKTFKSPSLELCRFTEDGSVLWVDTVSH